MSVDEEYLQKMMRTLSHDMGGTLRVAVGFSKLLLENYEDTLDEKAVKWLSLIKEDGEKTQEKLIALSRYARLYDIADNPIECELSKLCEKSINDSGLDEFYSSVNLTIETLPVVYGYERLWGELFVELVGNVAKHAGGAASIRCRVYSQTTDDSLIISVADNGVGLTAKQKEMAIMPYRTIEGAGPVGVGMGLPIAKRIAELQGGKLMLEDNPDEGTGLQLSIVLPRDRLIDAETAS
ncbi:MAG: sensor histidine kinase [Cellvibrionaceae bacterium]